MSLYTHKRADTVKWVIAFVLIAVLVVGMAVMALKISEDTTKETLNVFDWELGAFDPLTTVEYDTHRGIRTKDFYPCSGLSVTVSDDNYRPIALYYISFYKTNDNGEMELVGDISEAYEDLPPSEIPAEAEYFRMMIIANEFYDSEISIFEIPELVKSITVSYDK